jgi:hypothetical protein
MDPIPVFYKASFPDKLNIQRFRQTVPTIYSKVDGESTSVAHHQEEQFLKINNKHASGE